MQFFRARYMNLVGGPLVRIVSIESGSQRACVSMEGFSSGPSRLYHDKHEVALALLVLTAFCLWGFLDFEGKYCESRLCFL